jgi:hypothetical protein
VSDRQQQRTQRETRLQALRDNLEWLEEADLDEEKNEAVKRLGIVQGDARALVHLLSDPDDEPLVISRVVQNDEESAGGFWRKFK